jgi:hypothetical protein
MEKQSDGKSLDTLLEIRSMMERSSRFLSLSGMSGVWAGCTALAAAGIAYTWLPEGRIVSGPEGCFLCDPMIVNLLLLAVATFLVALAGAFYFTWRKTTSQGQSWSAASRQFLFQLLLPMLVGGVFCLGFIYYGHTFYVAPACLTFYGLALINAGRFTLSDIRNLGYLQVLLGIITLFLPGNGLIIWAIGFGVLHILYGIIMWNKYDKKTNQE